MLEDLLKELILVDRLPDGSLGPLIVGFGNTFEQFTPDDITALSNSGVHAAVAVGNVPVDLDAEQIKAAEATHFDDSADHFFSFWPQPDTHIVLKDTAAIIHDMLDGHTWDEAAHNAQMLTSTVIVDVDVEHAFSNGNDFKFSFQQFQDWEGLQVKLHHNDAPAQQEQQIEKFLDHWHL